MFDNLSTSALLASVFWGGLAGGFVIYGWKQKTLIPFLVGVALTAASYLMLNSALEMSAACIAILGGFYWLKRNGY
jgi:hypothetical protein